MNTRESTTTGPGKPMPQKKGVTARRLSPQEIRAVDEHLSGKSQKDALKAAGYSESTVETQAHRFFNRAKIITEIVRIMGPAMNAPEVIVRLSKHAREGKPEISMDALKTLAKHHKLLTDKVEASGDGGGPLVVEIVKYSGED